MIFAAVFLSLSSFIAPQQVSVRVEVLAADRPLEGASVTVAGMPHVTNAEGVVVTTVSSGTVRIEVRHDGYLTVTKDVPVTTTEQRVVVTLIPEPTHEEEITVSATRTDKRLDDQPMRVEVLGREEIEEKMLMTPGDIVMMLNEMGGMRVQSTSPSLGAASVRVQGMRGRYTRFLSDGLPIFGESPGGLGLLQIPPMDLGQVEVIKGVASALYGAGAMGGVIDLVSRRPGDEPEVEVLLNTSTRGGRDGVLWYSTPLTPTWGLTFLAGGHSQNKTDVDDDGWADLPHYARGVFRPRVFWDDGKGRSFFGTVGVTTENREGGTTGEGATNATTLARVEALETLRIDGGFVARTLVAGRYVLTARGAASGQSHDHQFGDVLERDRHNTLFGEAALRGSAGRHTWVAGAALEHHAYTARDVPRFDYSFTIPGVFLQDDVELTRWWSGSASARVDSHSEYGWFLSPRLSSLMRGGGWTGRVSFGTGFFGPSALTEETEAAGLTNLQVRRPLEAERGRSLSIDLTRTAGPLSTTATFFRSSISHPVHVERTTEYSIGNLSDPTTNTGVELLGTLRRAPFALTGSYTYVQARERRDNTTVDAVLTPRHSAGVVAVAEWEDTGRIGIEWYYTGEQRLETDPTRTTSEPYVIVGLLAERRFGRFRLFINGENLGNTRQTKWSPMLLPSPGADGRIAVDVWAPLEGRTINGGMRIAW
ncbi:MAG TPA: TonB-dependent receptor plug domain-containing protein [Vicinamibacterales bacterium]|nr:TonB-dependent receptor plug domain-containing protein [Vicinamibacterales bacterium]